MRVTKTQFMKLRAGLPREKKMLAASSPHSAQASDIVCATADLHREDHEATKYGHDLHMHSARSRC